MKKYWHKRAQGNLLIYDRGPMDILVDSRRYRYGAGRFFLKIFINVIPRPNVVILLDAPAEVLFSRKQEVSFEEVVRQRDAYFKEVRSVRNGVVINADQEVVEVVKEVICVIKSHLKSN